MASEITSVIEQLGRLSRSHLLDRWREIYGNTPSPKMRRELLVPLLAYRLQERTYGGLSSAALSELRRVANALKRSTGSTAAVLRPRIKPGTRFVRGWHGQRHEVTTTEAGFEYRSHTYKTLSKIARKITGTRWSGPAFFGLKKNRTPTDNRDE
jgi:hypothetical protein